MKKVLKVLVLGIVGVAGVVIVIGIFESDVGGPIETCEDLAPGIIEMSEEKRGLFSTKILKMYDINQNASPDKNRLLECTATAKMDRGGDVGITFYMEEDADGDRFIGMQRN